MMRMTDSFFAVPFYSIKKNSTAVQLILLRGAVLTHTLPSVDHCYTLMNTSQNTEYTNKDNKACTLTTPAEV